MVEVLVNTAVYGIIVVGFLNFLLIFVSGKKGILTFFEAVWMIFGIAAVCLLAFTVFFRGILRLDYMYYAGLTVSLFAMVALFLNLTQKIMRAKEPPM